MGVISSKFKAAREAYRYIPARLIRANGLGDLNWRGLHLKMDVPSNWEKGGEVVRQKYSSVKLDEFHYGLLTHADDETLVHGLLSAVFWGFASGVKSRVTSGRALARSEMILRGHSHSRPQNVEQILVQLRKTNEYLRQEKVGDALREARKVKFLGMSFASKVVMFMNPTRAAVYDSIISDKLRKRHATEFRSLYVTTAGNSPKLIAQQCERYERWCEWCSNTAQFLNRSAMKWTDWDGSKHDWRAVDVERAFFAAGDELSNIGT
ncbi:MAG TPA: hypothetical protein VLZ74_11135 [Methylocella sp.]|nr:hypothetical protein [Methylocella sp.]